MQFARVAIARRGVAGSALSYSEDASVVVEGEVFEEHI